MNGSTLLKFFSGPNAGAEALLDDGEYVLGANADCDLVLDDHLVIERHVRLTISPRGVECKPIGDARVYVEGKPTDGTRLAPFDFATIGGTSFALGDATAAWPMRPLPTLQVETTVAETPREPTEPVVETTVEFARPSRTSRTWIWTGAGLAAVALSLGVGTLWAACSPSAVVKSDVADRLRKALEWAGAAETVSVTGKAPAWTIEGRVPLRAVKDNAEKEVRRIAPQASIRIWDHETLTRQADEILKLSGFPGVKATVLDSGDLELDGEIVERDRWNTAAERVRHDLVGIRKVVDRVVVRTPVASPRRLVAAAPTMKQTPAPVVTLSAAAAAPVEVPLERIMSVSVGAERWIRLADGTRVGIGGRFAGDFEVAQITHDYVDLVKEQKSVRHFWRERRSTEMEASSHALDTASR